MPTRTKRPDLREYLDLEDLLTNKLQSLWGEEASRVFSEVTQALHKHDLAAAQAAVNSLDLRGVADKLKGFAYTISHAVIELGAGLAGGHYSADYVAEQVAQSMVRQLMATLTQGVAPQMQGQLAQLIAPQPVQKAELAPLYINRPLLNAQDLIDWAKANGFETTIAPEDMHVTIVFSRKPVDWYSLLPDPRELTYPGVEEDPLVWTTRKVSRFGDAVVLEFSAYELRLRWEAWRHSGASWDYDGYRPHVTLSYSGPSDLSTIKPYEGPLVFGGERFESIDTDKEFVEKWDVSDEPRDDHGRWTTDGAPTEVHSVDEAIKILGHHRGVMFEAPAQAVTLLDRLQQIVKDAQAQGTKAPIYDLCKVYVKGTNLFCQDSMKIPREKMPQLAGKPDPGSSGDSLPRNEWGEVDLTSSLAQRLQDQGVGVERTTMDARFMRATQNQLNGAKVAQIVARYEQKGLPTSPLMVSREGYIVDGHHRWAAEVGLEFKHNQTVNVPVIKVDMPILPLLKQAIEYSRSQGVMAKPLSNSQLVNKRDCGCDVSETMAFKWDESQHPRVPAGNSDGGEFTSSDAGEGDGGPKKDLRMPDSALHKFTPEQLKTLETKITTDYGVKVETHAVPYPTEDYNPQLGTGDIGGGRTSSADRLTDSQWGEVLQAFDAEAAYLKSRGVEIPNIELVRQAPDHAGADGSTWHGIDVNFSQMRIQPLNQGQGLAEMEKSHGFIWNVASHYQLEHPGDVQGYLQAVIRHEIGHALTTESMVNYIEKITGPERITKLVGAYAATSQMEGLAEIFATRFAPFYDGHMGPKFDALAESMKTTTANFSDPRSWNPLPKPKAKVAANMAPPKDDWNKYIPKNWPSNPVRPIEDAQLIAQVRKSNPNHVPAGSPQGGQFASADAAGAAVSQGPQSRGTGLSGPAGTDRPAPAEEGLPHFGTPTKGAVSVVGVHYSRQPRTALDGIYYGTGMRGGEARRLEGADPRLRQRIYFYVDTGHGTRPEDGVGSIKHEVRLDNLYNPKSDNYAIWREGHGDANASELAVLKHGFDGYYVDDFGVNQGVAVLLGDKHVPVKQVLQKWDEDLHPRVPAGSSEGGQFTSTGDEPGSAKAVPPKPGTPFTVFRLGSAGETGLQNRNAGNANGVALHLANNQDFEKPQNLHLGDTIHAYRVTVDRPFAGYTELMLGKPRSLAGSASQDTVGRTSGTGHISYTFGQSGYKAEKIGSVPLSEVMDRLKAQGYSNFDEAGTNLGAQTIREAFKGKILKYSPDQPRDELGRWTDQGGVPSELRGTLIGQGLKPSQYHDHALQMIRGLDAQHRGDPQWHRNVEAVKGAMANFPMIHTSQLGNVASIDRNGLLPAAVAGGGKLAFDQISGLDRSVFMRQGQAGGGGLGAVGTIIDPRALDPERFLITKLGAMTLKEQEDAFLRTPGDHRALVSSQLAPYRDTTIGYRDLADVQARLLVHGYQKDHPEAAGQVLSPSKVVANDHGEMEVKYVGTVPPRAIIGYFVGNRPLKDFGGKTAYQYLQDKVPTSKLIQYNGDSLTELSKAYRDYYAAKRETFLKSLRNQLHKSNPNHVPAGSPEGGQFASGDSGIAGFPKGVKLDDPSLESLKTARSRGVFDIQATKKTNFGQTTYELSIIPNDIPQSWATTASGDRYDPSVFHVNEFGRATPNNVDDIQKTGFSPESGYLFRGMSWEEYQQAKEQGFIKSAGDYNLGPAQVGLTYFSKDPDQARAYANGFAPWQYKPTPSRPAVIVKIKDPGSHVPVAGTGEDEVGLSGKVPFSSVVDARVGRPVYISPGSMDIIDNSQSGQPKFTQGSASAMMTSVIWEPLKTRKAEYRIQVRKLDPVRDFVSFKEDGDALLQMVSALHTNRLGSWGFMAQAQAQGMSQYMLRATLDDRTSNFCRMIDGRVFEVDSARPLIDEAVTANPDDLRNIQPWPDQSKAAIADYESMSDQELADLGLNLPPFHPWCRTVCVSLEDQSRLQAPQDRQQVLPLSIATEQDFSDLGIQLDERQLAYWNDYMNLNPTAVLSTLQDVPPVELLQNPQGDINIDRRGDIAIGWQGNQLTYNTAAGVVNLDPANTNTAEQTQKVNDATKAVALSVGARRIRAAIGPGDAMAGLITGYYPDDDEWDNVVVDIKHLLIGPLKDDFAALPVSTRDLITHVLASDESEDFLLLEAVPTEFLSRMLATAHFHGEIDLQADAYSSPV